MVEGTMRFIACTWPDKNACVCRLFCQDFGETRQARRGACGQYEAFAAAVRLRCTHARARRHSRSLLLEEDLLHMFLGEIQMRYRVYICSLFYARCYVLATARGISPAISRSPSLHFCKIIAAFEIWTNSDGQKSRCIFCIQFTSTESQVWYWNSPCVCV